MSKHLDETSNDFNLALPEWCFVGGIIQLIGIFHGYRFWGGPKAANPSLALRKAIDVEFMEGILGERNTDEDHSGWYQP